MSLPTFPTSDYSLSREEAINQILSSIAMEEISLSHIINAEGEKLQYALGTIPGVTGPTEPITIDDLIELNNSIQKTLGSAMQSQVFLKEKLEVALSASTMQGPTGPTGPTGPFLSSYIEVLVNNQTVATNNNIVFDVDSDDSVGNNISLDSTGTTFTITRTGLYLIEWDVNYDSQGTAVVGIIENGQPASGATSSYPGRLSSGTLIEVDTVPFTISLFNFGDEIHLDNPEQWLDSAGSIRILRFADGPSV